MRRPLSLTLAVALLSCTDTTAPLPLPLAELLVVSGADQTGDIGQPLASTLVVRVKRGDGSPAAGVTVAWSATTGSIATSMVTDSGGLASTTWTLGSTAGPATATAVVAGLPPASFTATATYPIGAIVATGAQMRSGTVGRPLAEPLVARVSRTDGSPAAGVVVGFTPAAGSVNPSSAATDANGEARTTWTLGNAPGPATVTATVNARGTAYTTVFNGTALLIPAAAAASAGNNQRGSVGALLPVPITVLVTDDAGTPVSGVDVRFSGSDTSARVLPAVVTTIGGHAQANWTLRNRPGLDTVTASVAGISVTFTATVTGMPTSVVALGGNGQSGDVATSLPQPIIVRVNAADGTPLSGIDVHFASPDPTALVTPEVATTDVNGRASATWRLGTATGAATATAQVANVPAVTFSATALAPVAALIASSGSSQSGFVGSALAHPIVAHVVWADGTAAAGVTVAFTPSSGSVSPTTAVTNATGNASTTWTLGSSPGAATVTATTGAFSTTFHGTGTLIPSVAIPSSGNNQRAIMGTVLPVPITVLVTDASGTPVSDVEVRFSAASSSAVISPSVALTSGGHAQATWQARTTTGLDSVTATVGGVSTVFRAMITGRCATIEWHPTPPDSAAQTTTVTVAVKVFDDDRDYVVGAPVVFATGSSSGTVRPASSTTNSDGFTTANWMFGSVSGPSPQTLTASCDGLTPAPSVSHTATVSP